MRNCIDADEVVWVLTRESQPVGFAIEAADVDRSFGGDRKNRGLIFDQVVKRGAVMDRTEIRVHGGDEKANNVNGVDSGLIRWSLVFVFQSIVMYRQVAVLI